MILLDTNVCIAVINGRPASVLQRLRRTDPRRTLSRISTISVFELRYGVAKSARKPMNAEARKPFSDLSLFFPSTMKTHVLPEISAPNWNGPENLSVHTITSLRHKRFVTISLSSQPTKKNSHAFPACVGKTGRRDPPHIHARSMTPASPLSVPKARSVPSALQASAVTGASPGFLARISAPSSTRTRSTSPSP